MFGYVLSSYSATRLRRRLRRRGCPDQPPPAGAYGAPPYMRPPPHRAVRAVGYLDGPIFANFGLLEPIISKFFEVSTRIDSF